MSWGAGSADQRDYLRLTVIADAYPAVEIWQTQRNALELMAEAFERIVQLDSTVHRKHISGRPGCVF